MGHPKNKTIARAAAIVAAVFMTGMALTACSGSSAEKTGTLPGALQGTWSCSTDGNSGKTFDIPGANADLVGGSSKTNVIISKSGTVTGGTTILSGTEDAPANVSAVAWVAGVNSNGSQGTMNVKPFNSLTSDAQSYSVELAGTTPATFSVSASKITLTLTKDNVTSTCTR